jgi:hypothetical protein
MAKHGFVTADGTYYESEIKLHPSHTQVALRQDVAGQQTPLDLHQLPQPVVREIPQPMIPPPPSREEVIRVDEDTQFQFKLKDIIVVVSFIVTIAISWNNVDTKMTRQADQITQMKEDISSLRKENEEFIKKRDELWRRQEDTNRSIVSQINDVERTMLNNLKR